MKKLIGLLALVTAFNASAINIVFEVDLSDTILGGDSGIEHVDTGAPNTFHLEYVLDFENAIQWQYTAPIQYGDQSGTYQVGTSNVLNTNFTLADRPRVNPAQGFYQQHLDNNYQQQQRSDVDLQISDNHTDARLDIWHDVLFDQYVNNPHLQDLNDTTRVGFSIGVHDEITWGVEQNGRQTGQSFEWISRVGFTELFDQNPFGGFADTDDLVNLLIDAMTQGTEFYFYEQLYVLDFERDAGNQSVNVDFNHFTDYSFLYSAGSARIVGLTLPTQVNEPATLIILLMGLMFLVRRRYR